MITVTDLAERISARGDVRVQDLSVQDLRALRAACDETGLTREGAASLARLDAELGGEALGALLPELVVDAVVYGERPTGRVTPEAGAWLAAVFGGGACPHGGRVLVEVVRAAQSVPPGLVEAAFLASKAPATMRAIA